MFFYIFANVTFENLTMNTFLKTNILIVLLCSMLGYSSSIFSQETPEIIQLQQPDLSLPTTLMEALKIRHSERTFSEKSLTVKTLSDMLWAANGINREDGKRTAPSAINAQDIEIYVCMKSGAYLYNAKENQLVRITTEDLRPAVAAGQQFVNTAPVSLVLVSNGDHFKHPVDMATRAMDAGYVSQNICLFCSANNLSSVPRATMNKDALAKGLKLNEQQIPLLNNVVGYKK